MFYGWRIVAVAFLAPCAGWVYDRTGSYDLAFSTFVEVAILVLTLLRLPEVEPGREPLLRAAEES